MLIGEAAVTAISLGVGMGYAISASAADAQIERDHEKLNTTGGQGACRSEGNGPTYVCADLVNASERAKDHRFFSQMGFIGAGVGAAAFTAYLDSVAPCERCPARHSPLCQSTSIGPLCYGPILTCNVRGFPDFGNKHGLSAQLWPEMASIGRANRKAV